ncbi:hypothetical protein BKA81DRAFT_396586, partial [Phyllosticta paracitricarpa]
QHINTSRSFLITLIVSCQTFFFAEIWLSVVVALHETFSPRERRPSLAAVETPRSDS